MSPGTKVDLAEALAQIDEAYSPRIVGYRCTSSHAGSSTAPAPTRRPTVLLIEPRGTPNTGDAGGPMSQPERELW